MKSVRQPLAMALAIAAAFPAAQTFAQSQSMTTAASVIVTAGRLEQAAKDVLADNVVISAEDIAKSGAATIVDLLQQQRGIEIARNGGAGSNASVFIRGGNNSQNVVLVDGVRIGSATTGGATWATIPLQLIDHIEIVYGPLSSLYGADAMGGVIQIFTKKTAGALAPTASLGVGSYGARQLQTGISGSISDKLSFSLNAAHTETEGFSVTKPAAGIYSYNADKDGHKMDSLHAKVNLEVAKGYDVGASIMQSRLNAMFDSGPSYDDRNVQTLETLALYGKGKISDVWTSSVQISQSGDQGYTDASYGKSQIDTRQELISFQNNFAIGKNVLQVIAERREEKVYATTKVLNGKRKTDSLAGSYIFKQDAHLASASLRYDHSSIYGNNTTGSIAYGYKLSDALRVNGSYGTSFRAPTFNELYYPGYGIASNKPEKAKNAEIGLYYEQGDNQLSAVYYRNKATDLLVSTNVCPVEQSTHPYGCAYNVNQATMSGLTIGGSTVVAGVTLRGSVDIQNPKDNTTGLQLARRAKKHGSLAAEYSIEKARFGVETVLSGQRFDDVANKKVLPGYGLLNLYGSYQLSKDLQVLARWNNALNKDYETAKNYATAGSTLFLGVNYGFK